MFTQRVYANPTGHRFFRDERGRISIGDQSGDTPEQTDDGPLIVEPGTICTLEFNPQYGLSVSVPVYLERHGDEKGVVSLLPRDFSVLRTLVPVSVARSRGYQKHLTQIFMIDNEVAEV